MLTQPGTVIVELHIEVKHAFTTPLPLRLNAPDRLPDRLSNRKYQEWLKCRPVSCIR
jgi:hypothetical protein